MTNELKPCPLFIRWPYDDDVTGGSDFYDVLTDDKERKLIASFSDGDHARLFVEAWNRRGPSPAPIVSVEECECLAEAACVGYHNDTTVWKFIGDDERAQWKHAALCVSRLTGGATRSEAVEAARAVVGLWRNNVIENSTPDDYDRAKAAIDRLARSLASHPASVAGAARPSFEEVRKAFYSVPGDGSMKRLDDGLRAVMALYERGAK